MSTQMFALAVFCGVLAFAAEIADRMPAPQDRYRRLADHADCGLGAEEYRGPRRYARFTDKTKAPGSLAKDHPSADDQNIHERNQP